MAVTLKAAAATANEPADKSLPDPSAQARLLLLAGILVAVAVAVIMNAAGLTATAFTPPQGDLNFALFAGFYAAAQIIERLMELISPLLPVDLSGVDDPTAQAAQAKADRAKVALGVAAIAGVAAACAFGLFFLDTVGITASHSIDSLCTGLVIASGTKPLHDFITLLQNQSTPVTKTTT